MVLKIAWRNIWRNKRRSMVVIVAIALGIWSIIFITGFADGMYKTMIDNAIENQYSHIQVHHPKYKEDQELKYTIPYFENLTGMLDTMSTVQAYSSRVINQGMISSPKSAQGIQIIGINKQQENNVSKIKSKIVEGTLFETKKKTPIVISKALAELLSVKLKSKVVVTMQNRDGNITQAAFKIVGLYQTNNSIFDETFAFARAYDLIRECELDTAYHELAIYLNNPDDVNAATVQLRQYNPNALVEDWRSIAPELELIESASEINLFIVSIIIMVALLFSIINTMLMAVLERYKELGVLMAIGLNRMKVFNMITLETIMLSLVGGPLGLLIGFLTIEYFQRDGIDFSRFSEGLREFGVNAIIRPVVQSEEYFLLAGIVILTAIIGAIYPAIKAVRLKPVEAIRKI